MAPIVTSTDIARPPAEVFAYVTDPARFGEWQSGVLSGHIEGDGPPSVGARCVMTRRMGGSERSFTSEITRIDPPRTWAIRGIDGPIRAEVTVTVEPREDGQHSNVTITLDFSGHGMGKMLLPMIIGQARTEALRSCENLRQRLERAT